MDDTLNVVDMEGRLKGDERRVGDFDCVWDDGPVAPIASASKTFLVELSDSLNLAASIGQQLCPQLFLFLPNYHCLLNLLIFQYPIIFHLEHLPLSKNFLESISWLFTESVVIVGVFQCRQSSIVGALVLNLH